MKTRLAALTLLDRALSAMSDDELNALVERLPEDHRTTVERIAGAPEGGFADGQARVGAIREAAARGRIGGQLEQLATVLADPALAQCIEALGDHADHPSEEQLLEVTPQLVEDHGLATVRLMMASAVAGEANASPLLIDLLRGDGEFGLPPVVERPAVVRAPKVADDEVRERRRAAKEAKKADSRARRAQQSRAGHRG